jgi:hypothetical protein
MIIHLSERQLKEKTLKLRDLLKQIFGDIWGHHIMALSQVVPLHKARPAFPMR